MRFHGPFRRFCFRLFSLSPPPSDSALGSLVGLGWIQSDSVGRHPHHSTIRHRLIHVGIRLDQYGNTSEPPFAGSRLLSRFNVHCSSTSGKPAASYRPCRPRPYPQYVKERSNIPRSAFRLPHWFTTPPQNPNSYHDNSNHFFQPTKTGKKPS